MEFKLNLWNQLLFHNLPEFAPIGFKEL